MCIIYYYIVSTTVVAHPVPRDLIFEIESYVSLQSCSIRTFFMANIKSEERERETERETAICRGQS